MRRSARLLLSTFLLGGSFVGGSAWAQDSDAPPVDAAAVTATAFVQSRAGTIIDIVNRAASTDAERAQRRQDLRDSVSAFLDIDLLAERTLGTHWEGLTPEQRVEFTALLRDLIETSYSRRLGTGTVAEDDYSVRYTGERARSARTTVDAEVTVRDRTYHVEAKLLSRGGTFVIYDIVTDDVSLEESYSESFDRTIRQHGWEDLLRRMRDRLERLRRE
jgi:phospholipid transport system substrate-binding protein